MNTELKTERVSVYAPKAEHGGQYLSVTQIKRHNEDIGHHFFSPDTLRFFKSKVYEDLHLGQYFITSEMNNYATNGQREYTIRRANGTGGIDTVGEFGQYSSLKSARNALKKIGLS
jgi:hypothetical protein